MFTGESSWYTFGFLTLFAVTIYSFLFVSSGKTLFILVVVVFLALRYVPILKYNQPLYEDPVVDLAVATEFEKTGTASVLSDAPVNYLRMYSGWPFIHLMMLAVHYTTGLSLFSVSTYFPPLLDLSSLLFVYLLANHFFKSQKIAALSGLLYATFSINMFWVGTQMIRQNIAFSLALMAVYLYLKGKGNKKMAALSLLVFGILPIAHHLTAMEMFYILSATLLLNILLNYWGQIFATILQKARRIKSQKPRTSISSPFTLVSLFFIGASMFMYWTTYAREIILPLFVGRSFTILLGVFSMRSSGDLPQYMKSVELNLDTFAILTYVRALFLVAMTIWGIVALSKEQNRYRSLLYGFLLAPLPLLLIDTFIERATDWRHALFFLIPVFLLAAKSMSHFDKGKFTKKAILGLCLLIVVLPAPFKLFRTLDPAPTYIYDRNSQFNFDLELRSIIVSRDEKVMAATSFMADSANGNLAADYYVAFGLLLHYDPYKVYPLGYLIGQYLTLAPKPQQDTILLDSDYYNSRQMKKLLFLNLTLPVEHISNLPETANCIYNNGEVATWKSP